jgi:hypothetical protein
MNPDRARDAHIERADLIEAERAPRRLPPSSSASAEPAR